MSTALALAEDDGRDLSTATLDELAAAANEQHAQATAAAKTAIEHAVLAGEALLEAKERVEIGMWTAWLAANFHGAHCTANTWMRLARFQDRIPRGVGVAGAERYLAGLAGWHSWRNNDEMIARAKALRAAGKTYVQVGEELGVSTGTAWHYVNSEQQRQQREAERAALAEQQREVRIRDAVRKAGAATAELYAMAERMQDVFAQAQRESDDPTRREELSLAAVEYRRMRDRIVRALGVQ